MKNLFRHLILYFYYQMAIHHDKQFKKYCKKHIELFRKMNPRMLQKQNGINIGKPIIDEIHPEHAYIKQEDKQ